jgi:hypothetical protein
MKPNFTHNIAAIIAQPTAASKLDLRHEDSHENRAA